jgi:hypothetical protein
VDTELRIIYSWVTDKFCNFFEQQILLVLFEDISEVTVGDANLKPFSAAAACVESVWVISTVTVAWRRSVGDFVF